MALNLNDFVVQKPRILPVIVAVDRSGSMDMNGKIDALNLALKDFINRDKVELASVNYNAEVQNKESYIQGTNTLTTTQRPDIVLRLTKTEDSGMKSTYLFDAKYRNKG